MLKGQEETCVCVHEKGRGGNKTPCSVGNEHVHPKLRLS